MRTTTNVAHTIRELTIYRLANEAECGGPDSPDSAGAQFLDSVRNAVLEEIKANGVPSEDTAADLVHEIADNAPDVYTHTRWAEFVDLAAYNEDISEYGDYGNDLTRAAGVALYMIAGRLALALFTIAREEEDA